MDENRRQAGTPGSEQEPSAPASTITPPQPEPALQPERKVGFKDIFGELFTQSNSILFSVALLLGLIGLLGGWDKVGSQVVEVPTVKPEQDFKAAPFTLAFQKAYWYAGVTGLPATLPGQRGLMVTVDMTNTSPRPVILEDVQKVFRTDLPGLVTAGRGEVPQLFRASDLLNLRTLQPGLKTRLVLIWAQDETTPAPSQLNVNTYQQTYRKSSLDGIMRYFDATEAAKITLPVEEFRVP